MPQKDESLRPALGQPLLIGLLIDVSRSMETSIENSKGKTLSRLESLRDALSDFVGKSKKTSHTDSREVSAQVVKVFVYGFGFRLPNTDICDVLTFLKVGRVLFLEDSLEEDISHQRTEVRTTNHDGHDKLAETARTYGYENKIINFARKHLSSPDAGKLAQELEKDQESAHELASLIPKTYAGAAGKLAFQRGTRSVIRGATRGKVDPDWVIRDDFKTAEQLRHYPKTARLSKTWAQAS